MPDPPSQSEMSTPICYLNTDLVLLAPRDPTQLVAAFGKDGVQALYAPQQGDDGFWHVSFELHTESDSDDPDYNPERMISAILDAIESLDDSCQALWAECSLKEFNIGYDCGTEPWAFNQGLTNQTLLRMAQAGASLRITLYPHRSEPVSRSTIN